jgi:flagellar hook-associated protein 1 FlgK
MAGLISLGAAAANNAQVALLTTQHNITNANTPGFNRQEVIQAANIAQNTGVGFIGQGAHVETVRRVYSDYLGSQVLSASAQGQYADAFLAQVSQIDNLLSDPNAGLSPALKDFFTGVNSVAANPTSIAARQTLLSSGQSLVSRFQSLSSRLEEIRNGVNTQLQAQITDINSYSVQIADLNAKINQAQNFNNQPPNDLLDQRDQAIAKLNEIVKVSVAKQSDGSFNIYIGTGQSLVTGTRASTLALRDDPLDPGKKNVNYVFGNSFVPIPDQSLETGGALGGLLAFRNSSLDSAQNALGRVALGLAQTFNQQHQLGQDLNGALGGKFFNIAPTSPQISGDTGNTGSLAFTATGIDAGKLTTSNYLVSYNGATYSLTDSVSNTTTSGLNNAQLLTALSNVGITLTSSGTPAVGDKFLILPTRNGARDVTVALTDPSTIAAAAPIRTGANGANGGTATISPGAVSSTSTLPGASVTLTYDSTAQTFTTASTDAAWNGLTIPSSGTYTSGATLSVNGVSFAISGAPNNGDAFTIAPNSGGAGDNRNAVALAALQSNNTLANNASGNPTTSYQGAYAQLVSSIGNDTLRTKNDSAAQQTLLTTTTQAQQSLSGVNLDEEAANLLRFQQAYQAAAKIIQTSSTLFDTILGIR